VEPGFVIPRNAGEHSRSGSGSPRVRTGYSDPADPNFEKNKGEYDCHYLHIHFRQKSCDTTVNTKILICTTRYWGYVATASVINDHTTRRRGRRTILKTLKGLKALQQRADSTNNMPAENDDKMTNSDEYYAQNEQNPTHFDANCTQKEVTLNFHMM
jgi:hypothetical protein